MIDLKAILIDKQIEVNNLERDKPLLYNCIITAMKEACEQTVDACMDEVLDEDDKDAQELVDAIRLNILNVKTGIK